MLVHPGSHSLLCATALLYSIAWPWMFMCHAAGHEKLALLSMCGRGAGLAAVHWPATAAGSWHHPSAADSALNSLGLMKHLQVRVHSAVRVLHPPSALLPVWGQAHLGSRPAAGLCWWCARHSPGKGGKRTCSLGCLCMCGRAGLEMPQCLWPVTAEAWPAAWLPFTSYLSLLCSPRAPAGRASWMQAAASTAASWPCAGESWIRFM